MDKYSPAISAHLLVMKLVYRASNKPSVDRSHILRLYFYLTIRSLLLEIRGEILSSVFTHAVYDSRVIKHTCKY